MRRSGEPHATGASGGATARVRRVLALVTGLTGIACGSRDIRIVDTLPMIMDPDLSGASGTSAASGTTAAPTPVPPPPPPPIDATAPPPCVAEATYIYLVDTAGVLHGFDPSLLPSPSAIWTIGTMNCEGWAGASSMAVDRNAVAWVTDRSGLLFQVSTADASCQTTPFRNQAGFTKVGMGFAGNAALGTETLYVDDTSDAAIAGSGLGLATMDLGSFVLTPIGNFDNGFTGAGAELTGTGDGRLFGFFPLQASIALIIPTNAHIFSSHAVPASTALSGAGEYDFAVSFWGGVFFMYTADTGTANPTTDISEFDPATGITNLVLSQIGFNVTGAGSSTCAPTAANLSGILEAADATPDGIPPNEDP